MRWLNTFLLFCGLVWIAGQVGTARGLALTAASTEPMPLASYWQTLRDTAELLAQLADPPDAAGLAQLNTAAERLGQIERVQWPDGSVVAVDHTYLVSQLRAQPPNLPQLRGRLHMLLAQGSVVAERPFATVDPAILARILARPEFQAAQAEPPAWLKWLGERWQRLLDWLDRLLRRDATTGRPSTAAATPLEQIATLVMLLLLAGFLAYALRGILADFVAEATLATDAEADHEPLTADRALRRAQELSSGGDYRAAVRYLYLSTLLRLEERGLLRYDRALTNREYIKRVAHDPALATVLRDVVEVFDRVWYGYQPLDASAYQRYANAVEALKNY